MDEWMDGWMEGWTDGWMNVRTDEWTDGRDILRFLTYQSTQPHVAPPALKFFSYSTVLILHGPS